jgi:SAM-dependent methyltransferase
MPAYGTSVSEQSHRSDTRVLGRRTLQRDHRILAQLLRPGMAVLDVGCGTGAITAGIARAVGPDGIVIGVDRDDALLEMARREHAGIPNLTFETGDVLHLAFEGRFDIVTATRTLQWVADPGAAVARMVKAARPAGTVVALDYNHEANSWEPDPPAEFRRFYRALLAWRAVNGWDNLMGDHLPALFRDAGLAEVESHTQDEVALRAAPEFCEEGAVWAHVIDSLGLKLAEEGFLAEAELRAAGEAYERWREASMERQVLSLRAVVGRVPR